MEDLQTAYDNDMKRQLTIFALLLFSGFARAQTNVQMDPQAITLRCGVNQVIIDSAVNIGCDFFTDSLVQFSFQNAEQLNRLQVLYLAGDQQPVTNWFNVDASNGTVTFSPRTVFSAGKCRSSRLILNYYRNNMNIRSYFINIDL